METKMVPEGRRDFTTLEVIGRQEGNKMGKLHHLVCLSDRYVVRASYS
jgi:hypothetical protein